MTNFSSFGVRCLLFPLAASLWAAPARAQLMLAGGSLSVLPNSTFSVGTDVQVLSAATFDNQGTVQLTGSLTSAGTIGSGAGLWQLAGSSLQTLVHTGPGRLASLEVNNPAGAVLGAALTIGNLTLTSGVLRLAAYDLTLQGTTSGAAASRFVATNGVGVLRQPVGTSPALFPVGPAADSYRPVTLTRGTGTATYGVGVKPEALTGGTSGVPYATHAVALHWTIAPPDDTPYDLTLQWNAADELPTFNRAASAVARWNGAAYVRAAYGAATGSGPYQRSSTGLMGGGPFVVLDQQIPLPVELTQFEARRPAGRAQVLLSWATASELNNRGFEVQRQDAGQTTFHPVGFVAGQGTKLTLTAYTFTDPNQFGGLSYYRLRQLDQNGTESFSPVRAVPGLPAGTVFSLSLFPNPASASVTLDATGPLPASLTLTLLAADGRVVWRRDHAEQTLSIPIEVSQLIAGAYWLRYQAADATQGTLPLVVAH